MNLNLRFAFGIVALMGLSMTSCDTFDDPVIGVIAPTRGPAFSLESDIQRIWWRTRPINVTPPAAVSR